MKKGSKSTQKNSASLGPIGVFDSGVGGLSILLELQKLLPKESFIFLGDQAYFPYGAKSQKELINRSLAIARHMVQKHQIKMLVVACNTATCSAVSALREKFTLPIIGTIPAVKPASKETKTGKIAVISTPYTSRSRALKDLIQEECSGVSVSNISCKGLERVVEEGSGDGPEARTLITKYMEGLKSSGVDSLVLGCTHYPFLNKQIEQVLGSGVKLFDSGKAIARQAKRVLRERKMANTAKRASGTLYFTTGKSAQFQKVAGKLLKKKVSAKQVAI